MFLMGSYAPDKSRTLYCFVLFHFDKKYQGGNSLLVQWLAPQVFAAKEVGSIPSSETKVPASCIARPKKKLQPSKFYDIEWVSVSSCECLPFGIALG